MISSLRSSDAGHVSVSLEAGILISEQRLKFAESEAIIKMVVTEAKFPLIIVSEMASAAKSWLLMTDISGSLYVFCGSSKLVILLHKNGNHWWGLIYLSFVDL